MYLESLLHGDSVFITLTYDDENYPNRGDTPQAQKKPLQLFLKRLRATLPQKIRYFICSEYGDRGNRLHFHGIIFGASMFDAKAIDDAWGLGFTQVGECNTKTCRYVAKYVTKGDSRSAHEHERPTWSIMSRNRGIGFGFAEVAGTKLRGLVAEAQGVVRIEGHKRTVGRYIHRHMRIAAAISDGSEPEHSKNARIAALIREYDRQADAGARVQSDRDAKQRVRSQKLKGKL